MRTHALMMELQARLAGASHEDTSSHTAPSRDWPRLPSPFAPHDPAFLDRLRKSTIAQIGVGRAGVRLRTETLLKFLGDRAVAVEAVRSRLPDGFARTIGAALEVQTTASDLDEFLLRPDLGRRLPEAELQRVVATCAKGRDVQLIVGDGLSAHAVTLNAPGFVPAFIAECARLGLGTGDTVLVQRARVKVMDQIGEALSARMAVILVGERPGLGTGDGMSAYMVFGPRHDAMDSDKEVLSNIHARGVLPEEAGRRVAGMLAEFARAGSSGVKRLASGAPPVRETARVECAQARDRTVERHGPPRFRDPAPLQTNAAARCAG